MGGERHALAALPPGKTRYPLYSRLGEPQGRSGWVRRISPPPTRIRFPDRPARSESLYRLSYPGLSNTLLRYLIDLGNQRINPVRVTNVRGGFDAVCLVLRAPGRPEQAGKERNDRWFLHILKCHLIGKEQSLIFVHLLFFLYFYFDKPEGCSLWRLELWTVGPQFYRPFAFVSVRWLYRQSTVTNLTPVFPYTCCSECFIKVRDRFRVVWIFDFLLFRNILWPSLLPVFFRLFWCVDSQTWLPPAHSCLLTLPFGSP